MTTTTSKFYAANHVGESAHMLASLVNKVTPEYEIACTKRYVGGRCVECTLAYQLVGELPVIEVFGFFRGNPPSQWELCHAEDMARRALKKQQAGQVHILEAA